ncbi:MAG: polyphosphate:AMP phosphotransferase [Pseudomonadales bacterium]
MFESAEVGSSVSKEEFKAAEPELRLELINAQYDLQSADFPVVLLLMGDDPLGVNRLFDFLHEWMDARFIGTHVFRPPTDEERQRPRFWRYWRVLPPKGRIGLYLGAWALGSVAERIRKDITKSEFARRIEHVRRFEEELVDGGALVIKLWVHLPRKAWRKRLKKKARGAYASQLDEGDWKIYERYDNVMPIAEQFIRETSTASAAWTVIESTNRRFCHLTAVRTLLSALQWRLSGERHTPSLPAPTVITGKGALSAVDLSSRLEPDEYERLLEKRQLQLAELVQRAHRQGVSTVLAFEGWDAAGKGGVIRRITNALFAQYYRVVPVAAPTDEENARHYLWRFWRKLELPGRILIFDRSWYGRVLVERVESFAEPAEWQRAYAEINDFEEQLVEHRMVVLKFWLHIDADEQLRRFQSREQTGYKKYKITDEDYRNREKWDDYVVAVNDMVARTSTSLAPWHLVPANDKPFARIRVLEILCEALKKRLG